MSDRTFRIIKVIMECLLCGAVYRPERGDDTHRGFCYKHRSLYWRSWYAKYGKKYKYDLSKYKEARDRAWKKWVEKNKERRRAQALASYHRRKKIKG